MILIKNKTQIKLYLFYSCFLLSLYFASAQNIKANPFTVELAKTEWDVRVNGYEINPNLALTLSQNLFSSPEIRLIEVPLLLKVKIAEKLSLIGGTKFHFSIASDGDYHDIGVSSSLGLQYDVNDDLYIRALFDYQLKPTNNVYHYNYGNPASFNLGTGFKF